jgi:hypothetical protein
MIAPMQPMPDPQVLQDEFADAVDLTAPAAPEGDAVELFTVPDAIGGTPCYGVACIEGVPDGSMPKRMWAPGSLVFAPTPFTLKFQPAEDHGHEGSMVAGRIDAIWRDGALIRWTGVMDSAGVVGAEAERLIAGDFVRGISIMADDLTESDIECVYPPPPDPTLMPMVSGEPMEAAPDAMPVEIEMPEPVMEIYHHGRVRSLTIVAEPAYLEATISFGVSPFSPPAVPEADPLAEAMLELDAEDAAAAQALEPVVVASSYTITIPELWPEAWFQQPTDAELAMCAAGGGAVQITPQGRVFGLLAPAGVDHRAFRASGQRLQVPRGIDYSEWQNKTAIVAGADGGVYKIRAGTVTFGCGHASPTDPRRADPSWAADHYDNSCSVAMRARAGEHPRFGTWFAGALAHGLTASSLEQIMGCALSGDWQGGKLKAALLVPCEGFPVAASGRAASIRERVDTETGELALVASAVPIHYQAPPTPPSLDGVWALIASATGRGPEARFAELAAERFAEISEGR